MRRKLHMNTNENNRKHKSPKKGFTLTELLAVILIITLIGGICTYSIINIINNSKEETLVMTENNIKKTAATYTEEKENIVWVQDSTNENNLISCVNIQELINEGYFKESILNNETIKKKKVEFIIVSKDSQSNTIVAEDFDDANTCQNAFNYVDKPSCIDNLTYDNTPKKLINDEINSNINFENNTATDAGKYEISLTPKDNYVWKNGTRNTINKECSIAKAKIKVELDPNVSNNQDTTIYTTVARPFIDKNSNNLIAVGNITITSSNEQNAIANPSTIENAETGKNHTITINANTIRSKDTIFKITFTPNDTKNYESGTTEYTLYGSNTNNLYKVTLDPNGGSLGEYNNTFLIAKGKKYGSNLDVTPTKIGYTFDGWYTSKEEGTKITSTSTFTSAEDTTLYAHWTINKVYLQLHMNGGTWAGSTNTSLSYSGSYVTNNGKTISYTYDYGQTGIDLPNWDNSKYINISKVGYIAKTGAEWNLKANGTGKSFNDTGTVVNANDLCDASVSSCTATLYVNWTRNFTCSAKGSNTTYAGLQWTTKSNANGYCELVLNKTSNVSGSYDNATTNLTNSYFKSGGKDYNETLTKEKNAGLISNINTNSGKDGTVSVTNSGFWWYDSEKVVIAKNISTKSLGTKTKLYYGVKYSGTKESGGQATPKGDFNSTNKYLSCDNSTTYKEGNTTTATNSESSVTFNTGCSSKSDYFSTTYNKFVSRTDSDSTYVRFSRANSESLESGAESSVKAKSLYIESCGGEYNDHNDALSITPNKSNYIHINYKGSTITNSIEDNSLVIYAAGSGIQIAGNNGDGSAGYNISGDTTSGWTNNGNNGKRILYLYTQIDNETKKGTSSHPTGHSSLSGVCKKYTYYTGYSTTKVNYYYRLHIKVKM